MCTCSLHIRALHHSTVSQLFEVASVIITVHVQVVPFLNMHMFGSPGMLAEMHREHNHGFYVVVHA
jgi:hypothetical protein